MAAASSPSTRTARFLEWTTTDIASTPQLVRPISSAWGQQGIARAQDGHPALRIDGVALSEFVLEFSRFVEREMASRWGDSRWPIVVGVRRSQSAELPLLLPADVNWLMSGQPAETDERTEAFAATLDPAIDAATLLAAIYGVFGLEPSSNRFISDGAFQVDRLLAL